MATWLALWEGELDSCGAALAAVEPTEVGEEFHGSGGHLIASSISEKMAVKVDPYRGRLEAHDITLTRKGQPEQRE